jgi:hypothetical protein
MKGYEDKKSNNEVENTKKKESNEPKYSWRDLSSEEFEKYYNEVDPRTGQRYHIPMLSITDPAYPQKYVDYMLTKKYQPYLFQTILNWD